MFKSCCARPNKKINKSKANSENMDVKDVNPVKTAIKEQQEVIECEMDQPTKITQDNDDIDQQPGTQKKVDTGESSVENPDGDENAVAFKSPSPNDDEIDEDTLKNIITKNYFSKKRFSMDYKKSRLEFKRFSVDYRRDADAIEQLQRLEEELARTNMEVRPGLRRKSSGILKSTTSSIGLEQNSFQKESCSDDDDVFEAAPQDGEGPRDPPATPVGRDELALRRHRFFSDLVCAARAAVEHRVRFDPLGPVVADLASEELEGAIAAPSAAAELEALIERLERVTSRLERLPLLAASSPGHQPSPRLDTPPPEPATQELLPTDNMSLNGYQDIVQGPLRTYLELSAKIGGDVASQANLVKAAFEAQLRYIGTAASRSKPAQAEEVQLLAPTSEQISAIQQFREKNRTSSFFNHLSAISESIPALGWVAVSPTPAPYVKEMNDAGQFYTNRVLKEWKEKDKRHAEWCRAWVQLLSDLQAYVKQYHTTGLVWSGKGPGAGAGPGLPPPPPPPSMPEVDFSNLSVDDRSALFAEINRGETITNSLRKVTSDMQTHKNPQLRQGPAPFKAGGGGAPSKPLPAPGAGNVADKPPVFMRDGKKWLIEYQRGNPNLVVEKADMNNVVYMFRCRDSALTVRGKVNGVVLDSCTKCAVVFDNLVSSIEFVNCQSVQMQVLGKVPTISIDKTDGCQMYLSPEALDVEIVSSKSSEMNVLVPKGNGDYTEFPIPEQFKTTVRSNRLETTPVESKG